MQEELRDSDTGATGTAYDQWPVTIRTFKPRSGRMSLTQREALQQDSGRYLVGSRGWPFIEQRAQDRDIVADIGFGFGESVLGYAASKPEELVLGFEIHLPGVGSLCDALQREQIDNVVIAQADAQLFLADEVPDGALAGVRLFFPDPWPKKRHHKRRFIREHIVDLLARKIRVGGFLHIATDVPDYAEDAVGVLESDGRWQVSAERGRPAHRPQTRFERRAVTAGRPVCDVIARRVGDDADGR